MTQEHVNWALDHDWCFRAELMHDGTIQVIDRLRDVHRFDSFKAMRDWAGY